MSHEFTPAARDSILMKGGKEILMAVEHDWRRMCGNAVTGNPGIPDPYRMDRALPYTFILQRATAGSARVRVAGQKLHEMVQMDPRGMSFGCFFSDGANDTVHELIDAALTLPAIVRIPLTAPRPFGLKPSRAEALLLPMRDPKGDLTRIMGVIVSEFPLRNKAVHWDIDATREVHCEALTGQFPDRREGPRAARKVLQDPPVRPIQARQTIRPLAPTKTPQIARGGLRLVVDNT